MKIMGLRFFVTSALGIFCALSLASAWHAVRAVETGPAPADTCKVTVWTGECSNQHPGDCNSGIGGFFGCIWWEDEDRDYFICQKAGRGGYVPGSWKANYPECKDRSQDGRKSCKAVTFYCYAMETCAWECDWFNLQDGTPVAMGCLGVPNTQSGEGQVEGAEEASGANCTVSNGLNATPGEL